jgi:hypothetical protein
MALTQLLKIMTVTSLIRLALQDRQISGSEKLGIVKLQ